MLRLRTLLTCWLALVLSAASFSAENTSPATASPWVDIPTDLPPDPALREGKLANGLRYLILPNAEPKDHVSLRLLVGVGSLHENADELGLAHFVEHMAFRGTRAFPNGQLTQRLQRLGIGLGPDSTAFTNYDHTVYHLELPDAKESTLREALHAFREYSDAVTFEPSAIEQERGVVLSEMAMRDSPQARASEYNLRLLWPDAREVQRRVIGSAAQIRSFKRDQFRSFYEAWYRPERIALVIVGAVDPALAERLVSEYFASLAARGVARPEPADLIVGKSAGPNVGVFSDPGILGMSLTLEIPRPYPRQPDTHAQRVRQLHRALAFVMFQQRLQKLSKQEGTAFVDPIATLSSGLRDWEIANVAVAGRIDDWRRVALEVEQAQRRAFQFGFTQRELTDARAMFATRYEEAVRSAATRPSGWLAQQLLGKLLYGTSFTTPAALKADLAADLEAATLADCRTAFRSAWTTQAPTVFVCANPSFAVTRAELAAALNESRKVDVTAPEEVTAPPFGYTNFGPPGELVRDEILADLDVRLAQFANGVRFNFKATAFEADGVEVRVRFGDGKLSQLLSRPGLDLLADAAFTAGGVGRHRFQELNEILASHALQLMFQVDSDACLFYAHCARRELPLALQVIAAYLTDASFRPESIREAQVRFSGIFSSLAASPGGPITALAPREMFNHDGRFGVPNYDELSARDLGELEAWLGPQLKQGPLELSIAGDVSWDEARSAVAATLGALPPRNSPGNPGPAVPVTIAPPQTKIKGYPLSGSFKQVAVAAYWFAGDSTDIHHERRCHLLAAILAERLRIKLRDALGATYAPLAVYTATDGFPNAQYFTVYAEVNFSQFYEAFGIIDREIAALRKSGPSADEFERAKLPYNRMRTDELRTNAYWGGTVLSDAQQRPMRLAAARDRAADMEAITRAEIKALANQHLDPAHAFKFVTIPPARSPTQAPAVRP